MTLLQEHETLAEVGGQTPLVKSFIDVYLKTVQWYLSIKQCSDTYPVSNTGIYKARLKEYYSLLMSAR